MSTHRKPEPLNYRDAGVDIDQGNRLVAHIKTLAQRTSCPEILAGVGGFGALFQLPSGEYETPVLVSGADGVGTKLKLAIETGIHNTIGIDLVAMCANDVLVHGAKPLFFLDYFATGKLDLSIAKQVVEGISRGCEQAGAALIGGETAEMPGVYQGSDYDLAGFCVGIVEKANIIDGGNVAPGDVLIGLAASGPHSNGHSLIRKVLERTDTDLGETFDGKTFGETLLAPTCIYVRPILEIIQKIPVQAIAHITGGGILENLPRVLPAGVRAAVNTTTWPQPPIFDWLKTAGGIAEPEMYRTFNCGIGMMICVRAADAPATMQTLEQAKQPAWEIGHIEPDPDYSPTSSNSKPSVLLT